MILEFGYYYENYHLLQESKSENRSVNKLVKYETLNLLIGCLHGTVT